MSHATENGVFADIRGQHRSNHSSAQSKQGPLRKHVYSNILKILPPKIENFSDKNSVFFFFFFLFFFFHISAQNINCGYSLEPPRRGGYNEYHNLCVLSRNKKNNVYPFKSQFYYIKVGFKGVNIV